MSAISSQRQAKTKMIFHKFDKDSDGFITVKDLISVFRELGEDVRDEELREQLQNAGLSHRPNTMVSFDIFQQISKEILCQTKKERQLKRVFQEFDTEKKGFIEGQGIKRVLRRLSIDHTDSDIDLMMKMADTKGDGRVDFEEFLQIFNDWDHIY